MFSFPHGNEPPGLQSAQMTNISVPAAKENAVFFVVFQRTKRIATGCKWSANF